MQSHGDSIVRLLSGLLLYASIAKYLNSEEDAGPTRVAQETRKGKT
jgi:hypothetical protein